MIVNKKKINHGFVGVVVTVFLFIITIICGFIGWFSIEDEIGDRVYLTLLAFGGGVEYLEPANIWINVARFTGWGTAISTVITIFLIFAMQRFVEQITRWRASRLCAHTVVIGVSDFAVEFANSFGRPITIFDTTEKLERMMLIRDGRHTPLKIAGRIDANDILRLNFGNKPAVIIFGDADELTNVLRAKSLLSELENNNRLVLRDSSSPDLYLRIEDDSVATDLAVLGKGFEQVELISQSEFIARELVTNMTPTSLARLRGQGRVHVVLIGLDSVNLAVAEELALRCHDPNLDPLRLTIIDYDRKLVESRLRAQRPNLRNPDFGTDDLRIDICAMDVFEYLAASKTGFPAEIEDPLTAIVVATGETRHNMAIAMCLRNLQLKTLHLRAPIFVRDDTMSSVAPSPLDNLTGGIVYFGGYSFDENVRQLHEDLAKELHRRWQEKNGGERWEDLTAAGRRTNFRAAMWMCEMFHAAGFTPTSQNNLSGFKLEQIFGEIAVSNLNLLENLSCSEHTRWCAERRLEGYRVTKNGENRDREKDTHQNLIPYGELSEEDRQKDRDNIRAHFDLGMKWCRESQSDDCWRKLLRVGLFGPLRVEDTEVEKRVSYTLDHMVENRPAIREQTLEILSPNAPGFDRVALCALAKLWREKTGRPARIILFNAASIALVDRLAARVHPEIMREKYNKETGEEERPEAVKQTGDIEQLGRDGCYIRSVDMRPLGVSDVELESDDRGAYDKVIREMQDRILNLADLVLCDTQKGKSRWTMRMAEKALTLDIDIHDVSAL